LQGALLEWAQLQGTDLRYAQLQGASLKGAHLQGADLEKAQLLGADLRESYFYHKSLALADVRMVDARGLQWQPLSQKELENLQIIYAANGFDWIVPLFAIQDAAKPGLEPPEIKSCLRDDKTELQCAEVYSLDKIRKSLEPELEKLVCLSANTARGILTRYDRDSGYTDSVMAGFLTYLGKKLAQSKSEYECLGLSAMNVVNTTMLKRFVDMEHRKEDGVYSTAQ
ncbi:MAG: pentapeptide repeat-containing protein, partial [Nitrospira sp.]